jgi:hypothetical protein
VTSDCGQKGPKDRQCNRQLLIGDNGAIGHHIMFDSPGPLIDCVRGELLGIVLDPPLEWVVGIVAIHT